jgi:hypothetical protein
MDTSPLPPPSISWNGLTLDLPPGWEPIIGGKRHLIFESEHRPILELRWDPGQGSSPGRRQRSRILAQLDTGNTSSPDQLKTPDYLALSEHDFDLQAFGAATLADGALITCRRCGTLILAKFHSRLNDRARYRTFFSEFACQHQDGGDSYWAIQDISFTVPQGFDLQRYGITFGMSSFSFTGRNSQLHLCRLAPASEHLRESGFTEMFRVFSKAEPGDEVVEEAHILRSWYDPHILKRMAARLRRQYPFRRAMFRHVEERDRILGFRLESRRPIPDEMLRNIQESYGLVQEKG